MTEINRKLLRDFRDDAEKVLADVAKKHGVSVKFGSGTYSDGFATLKLELGAIGANGEAATKEAENFKHYAYVYGLKPENLGSIFSAGGKSYILVGLHPRRQKFPFIGKRGDGKMFKFSEQAVRNGLQPD